MDRENPIPRDEFVEALSNDSGVLDALREDMAATVMAERMRLTKHAARLVRCDARLAELAAMPAQERGGEMDDRLDERSMLMAWLGEHEAA